MIKILRTKLRKKKNHDGLSQIRKIKLYLVLMFLSFFFLYKIPFYLYFNLQV